MSSRSSKRTSHPPTTTSTSTGNGRGRASFQPRRRSPIHPHPSTASTTFSAPSTSKAKREKINNRGSSASGGGGGGGPKMDDSSGGGVGGGERDYLADDDESQLNISEISNNYYKNREDKKANKEEAYKREIATIFGETKSKIEVKWAGETERVSARIEDIMLLLEPNDAQRELERYAALTKDREACHHQTGSIYGKIADHLYDSAFEELEAQITELTGRPAILGGVQHKTLWATKDSLDEVFMEQRRITEPQQLVRSFSDLLKQVTPRSSAVIGGGGGPTSVAKVVAAGMKSTGKRKRLSRASERGGGGTGATSAAGGDETWNMMMLT